MPASNDRKTSSARAYTYLVDKCTGKSLRDLERLTDYMRKIMYGGSIKIEKEEFNGDKYVALVHNSKTVMEGTLFKLNGDTLEKIGTGKGSQYDSFVFGNGIHNALISKLLELNNKEYKAAKDKEREESEQRRLARLQKDEEEKAAAEAKAKEERERIRERDGIKYQLLSHYSSGDPHSIYGSDSITIKVVDGSPVEKVKKVFDDPLADFYPRGNDVYDITYYRD